MQYRFTLINETLGSYMLPDSPKGWDEMEVTLQRSDTFHAVNRDVPAATLLFTDEAADYIEQALSKGFVNEKVDLKVEIKINDFDYRVFRQYTIHYADLRRTIQGVEVRFNSGEIENKFESNNDTVFELEMDDEITVKPVQLIKYGRYEAAERIVDTDEITDTEFRENLIFNAEGTDAWGDEQFFANVLRCIIPFQTLKRGDPLNFQNERGLLIDGYQGEPNNVQHFFSWDRQNEKFDQQIEGIYYATEEGELTVKLRSEIVLGFYVGGMRSESETINQLIDLIGFNNSDRRENIKVVLKNKRESFVYKASSTSYTLQQVNGASYGGFDYTNFFLKCTFEIDFPLSVFRQNDVYFMFYYIETANYVAGDGSDFAGVNKIAQTRHDVDVFAKLYGENATIPAISVGAAMEELTSKLLGETGSFKSKWFNQGDTLDSGDYRSGKTDYLTTGKAFRYVDGDTSEENQNNKILSISIADLFQSMNNIYCLGLSIQQSNRVKYLNCETRDFYYLPEYGGHLGTVQEYTEEMSADLIYKSIDFSATKIREEEYSNRYAFNVPFSYKTPVDTIKGSIELPQTITTSAITLELARRAAKVEDESDFDDNIFVTKCTDDKKTLRDEATTAYEGLPDVTYLANQDYCGARSLRYFWSWWLAAALQFLKSETITLEKNNFNRTYKATRSGQSEVSSGANLDISTIMTDDRYSSLGEGVSLPMIEPFMQTFRVPLTYEKSKMLENNRHKIFSFDTHAGRKYGYIRKAPTIPNELSEFEMIKASKYAISQI